MTCVVGIRGTRGVLLAGDSQFSSFNSNRKVLDPKTFQLSEVVAIAYCGSGRLGQILTYHMVDLDEPPLGMDEHRWAVRDFLTFLRSTLDDLGHLHIHRNVEHLGSSAFLLAVRGRLFAISEDFDVMEHRLAFDALGSGDEAAMGAMLSEVGQQTDPLGDGRLERLARKAIGAASESTNYVGGEVRFSRTVTWTPDEKALARRILGRR